MSHNTISIRIIQAPVIGYGITLPIYDSFHLQFPPVTIVFQDSPQGENKTTRYPLSQTWINYIASINTPDAFRWLMNVGNMYINPPQTGTQWLAESIMSLSYFGYNAETETHVRVVAFDHNSDPAMLNPYKNRHWDEPTRWSKASAADQYGNIINVGNGYGAYWPIMGHAPVWLNKKFCLLFKPGRNYNFREGHKIYDSNHLLFEYRNGQRYMPDPTWQYDFQTFVPAQEAYP